MHDIVVEMRKTSQELMSSKRYKLECAPIDVFNERSLCSQDIGIAPITYLRTCVIKIVAFKGGQ